MSDRRFELVIDGKKVSTDDHFPVFNPATGEIIALAPDAVSADVTQALSSAEGAFPGWSGESLKERSRLILGYADLLEEHRDEIIALLIAETGKPRDNAEYDFGMLPTCLRFFVEEAARIEQPTIRDPEGKFLNYIVRQPLGVVVGYLAWNFPLLNFGYKAGPVLASGCTAVIKPSKETPLATLRCAELAIDAGIPRGVINVITSSNYDVTNSLLTSDSTAMFTMIGSTASGVRAMRTALTNVKHFSVELGGNAPVIVFPDADIKAAARSIVELKFSNTGQVCVSPNRCFVHESVYDDFVAICESLAGEYALSAGNGDGPVMGPMINGKERQRVLDLIDTAIESGATLVSGGKIPPDQGVGYYLEPTILSAVTREMSVAKEEIFGPVLPIISYSDADDVVKYANETEYGLSAYVYTRDLKTGLKAAAEIEAGSVCVNQVHYAVELPHGGLKQSGVGKDCSKYSLEEYMTLKRVSVYVGD